MNDQKWRSPTGHPIASHETDKLPKINDVEDKTMSDLKTVRDALEESLSNTWQDQARKVEIENILATLDRMIETPAPTETLATEAEQLRNDYGSMGVTLAARNSEIEELKAKLDKAKAGLEKLASNEFDWSKDANHKLSYDDWVELTARKTLEEI